ncbi:hypothetical protein D9M72_311230 [compost metagenome]
MTDTIFFDDEIAQAVETFERAVGVTGVQYSIEAAGPTQVLKFHVGKLAPVYDHALLVTQRALDPKSVLRGNVGLIVEPAPNFPGSLEAGALLTLLTRSTREIIGNTSSQNYSVPYVGFPNREDHSLAQTANHIVRGRRGVGKSTLMRRALNLLGGDAAYAAKIDMQTYSMLEDKDEIIRQVLIDACRGLSAPRKGGTLVTAERAAIDQIAHELEHNATAIQDAPVKLRRAIAALTKKTKAPAFVFLDDMHLIDKEAQPEILHTLHACLKGANGWLKVAGVGSLLNPYSPKSRRGLQFPGDAHPISLDLTLENPAAAEKHLRAIVDRFSQAVGYAASSSLLAEPAFRRLTWANAGVPRDFLQMLGSSLEHAQRNGHATITLSDVNMAIGEFGQQKMEELRQDVRNGQGLLQRMLTKLEDLCLDQKRVNAFLVRSGSWERDLVQILSDMRMVHLIRRSVTPGKSGEQYEAYILDYSLFTGFRRRPNLKEMRPQHEQFKASELRALPKVAAGFLIDPQTGVELE